MMFSRDKISISMSSTDKYIQGKFIQVYMLTFTSEANCHFAFSMFFDSTNTVSCKILHGQYVCYIFCTDIYNSARGRSLQSGEFLSFPV